MNRRWNPSSWISRVLLLAPILLFLRIGLPNLIQPTAALGARGIAFQTGFGLTTARMGFGAFPLAFALFLAGCLFPARRMLTGFAFIALLDGVILTARTIAMFPDGSVRENMPLVIAEIVLMILAAAGIFLELRRRSIAAAAASSDNGRSVHSGGAPAASFD